MDLMELEDFGLLSAVAVGTACVASVCATAVTLGRSGESCVSATTSTVLATKENCAQVRLCLLLKLNKSKVNHPSYHFRCRF